MSEIERTVKIAFYTAIGNWFGDSLLYPLEAISTRLKANKYISHNPFQFAKKTFKEERFKLYKGVQLTFPAAFMPTFIYICIYEWGMKKVQSILDSRKFHESSKLYFPFFVSSVAEIVSMMFYLPIDTIRTRVQLNEPSFKYKSLASSLSEIAKKQGIGRFYKSTRLYLLCRTLQIAVTFQSFQMIRYLVGPSTTWMIINTIISTAISTTLLNPLEVLITRYAIFDTTKKKLVLSRMIKKMRKREGFSGFYKGYAMELIHHIVYALFWMPLYQIYREQLSVEASAH